MKQLAVAVGGLFVDDHVPLIRFKRNHAAGYWAAPGGKFDAGEWMVEALEREMAEEIEHQVRFKEFCAVVDELIIAPNEEIRIALYICLVDPVGRVDMKTLEHDEGTIKWWPVAGLPKIKHDFLPSDYRIMHDVMLGSGRGYYRSQMTLTGPTPVLDEFEQVGPLKSASADTRLMPG